MRLTLGTELKSHVKFLFESSNVPTKRFDTVLWDSSIYCVDTRNNKGLHVFIFFLKKKYSDATLVFHS